MSRSQQYILHNGLLSKLRRIRHLLGKDLKKSRQASEHLHLDYRVNDTILCNSYA